MTSNLNELKIQFNEEIQKVSDLLELGELEIKYLGRKAGQLTGILRGVKDLPEDQRGEIGRLANQLKQEIETKIEQTKVNLKHQATAQTKIDVTLPGTKFPEGHLHLVTQTIEEIENIFERIGFARRRYPEIDWDYYAFESLNMPAEHPARDEWETFFIDSQPVGPKGQRVLTPHTSNGQVREMEQQKPPIRMINISKCYRRQIDASHLPMFYQFEGMYIDENVTLGHLKGAWQYFVHEFFGPERKVRMRQHHFQFTEPSLELDVSCGVCNGKGCKMCKQGWLELGGGGMINPRVLKAGKVDPKKYTGFAFGWGVERCFLMKEGLNIPDIRILYQNDERFLNQF